MPSFPIPLKRSMAVPPVEVNLELRPQSRLDLIDVTQRIREGWGSLVSSYPKALYCSYHTTAGYLEQSLSARLRHSPDVLGRFVGLFGRIFPRERITLTISSISAKSSAKNSAKTSLETRTRTWPSSERAFGTASFT